MTVDGRQDCYFFIKSSCLKGNSCQFRHNQGAKNSTLVCSEWKEKKTCTIDNCQNRHSEYKEVSQHDIIPNKSEIACYWEKNGGCLNKDCTFKHVKPKETLISPNSIPPSSTTIQTITETYPQLQTVHNSQKFINTTEFGTEQTKIILKPAISSVFPNVNTQSKNIVFASKLLAQTVNKPLDNTITSKPEVKDSLQITTPSISNIQKPEKVVITSNVPNTNTIKPIDKEALLKSFLSAKTNKNSSGNPFQVNNNFFGINNNQGNSIANSTSVGKEVLKLDNKNDNVSETENGIPKDIRKKSLKEQYGALNSKKPNKNIENKLSSTLNLEKTKKKILNNNLKKSDKEKLTNVNNSKLNVVSTTTAPIKVKSLAEILAEKRAKKLLEATQTPKKLDNQENPTNENRNDKSALYKSSTVSANGDTGAKPTISKTDKAESTKNITNLYLKNPEEPLKAESTKALCDSSLSSELEIDIYKKIDLPIDDITESDKSEFANLENHISTAKHKPMIYFNNSKKRMKFSQNGINSEPMSENNNELFPRSEHSLSSINLNFEKNNMEINSLGLEIDLPKQKSEIGGEKEILIFDSEKNQKLKESEKDQEMEFLESFNFGYDLETELEEIDIEMELESIDNDPALSCPLTTLNSFSDHIANA
ncbi:hypothetical protein BB558_006391 [Smittium angustum]|uniref:C3H1-type domain-containing protein n=1 Tax=Smittium angustum TaxID=133377 RepID=A0A2U1IXY5_SMIAN|nr:hypothetical protein BB558_006391 [Smittium angustum]